MKRRPRPVLSSGRHSTCTEYHSSYIQLKLKIHNFFWYFFNENLIRRKYNSLCLVIFSPVFYHLTLGINMFPDLGSAKTLTCKFLTIKLYYRQNISNDIQFMLPYFNFFSFFVPSLTTTQHKLGLRRKLWYNFINITITIPPHKKMEATCRSVRKTF